MVSEAWLRWTRGPDERARIKDIEREVKELRKASQISASEQARMRSAVKPVHEKFAASYDPVVVKLFKSELERVSKN